MNGFLRRAALLSLLRAAVDLLLPEGTVHRLCGMAIGLMVMIGMLQALSALLPG